MALRQPHTLYKRQLGLQSNGRQIKTGACKSIQERRLVRFHSGTDLRKALNCFDGEHAMTKCARPLHNRIKLGVSCECAKHQVFESAPLAGDPGWRPLIFSAIGDLAFFAAGHKLENDHFAAVQAGPSVILGGGKDQPMPFQDFVRPALGEDLIAPVRIHFQGRSAAMMHFARDFNAYAVIRPFEGRFRPRRLAAEDQADSSHDENLCNVVKRPVMASHSSPWVLCLSGPEGLRYAIWSAFTKKQCKRCAIKVTI